jgi:hypothetical protein
MSLSQTIVVASYPIVQAATVILILPGQFRIQAKHFLASSFSACAYDAHLRIALWLPNFAFA